MNFLPLEYREKQKQKAKQRRTMVLVPLLALALLLPAWQLFQTNQAYRERLQQLEAREVQLVQELQQVSEIDRRISEAASRREAFGNLFRYGDRRVIIIKNMEKYIPKEISYTKILLEPTVEEGVQPEGANPIYQQVGDSLLLEGATSYLESIGRFVFQLNQDARLTDVRLESIAWDETRKQNVFRIQAAIKGETP